MFFVPRFLLLHLILFVHQITATDAYQYVENYCEIDGGKYTTTSTYQQNLNSLLHNLSSKSSALKFDNFTVGVEPDKAYGLYECRHDLSLTVCSNCIADATLKILQMCPFYREALVWYDECMLRFANRSFFSVTELAPFTYVWDSARPPASDYPNFESAFQIIVKTLINDPGFASSESVYFATAETNVSTTDRLYGFAQCTHGVAPVGCITCLRYASSQLTLCCNQSLATAYYLPSCQLRYDSVPFIVVNTQQSVTPSLSPPSHITGPDDKSVHKRPANSALVIGLVVGGLISVALLFGGIAWCLHRNKEQIRSENGELEDSNRMESVQFDFNTIKAATQNFSGRNKLGQGGFGYVYKGKLDSGQDIAVKRLSENSQQGNLEFKNEVLLVAKLQHKNLVKLLGFCVTGKEQLLIYEFLPNLSLDHFMHDKEKRASLNWDLRFRIITGIARGLLYLHEDSRLKIIHRDLKPSNILLDEAMDAKITDFGLARLFAVDQTEGATVKVAGTHGYMAPEYALAGHFSVKSDVYSFGVIILELVSGQRNSFFNRLSNEEGLVDRAWRVWNQEAALELVDPVLGDSFSAEQVKLCIHVGLLCIQEDPTQRPRMPFIVNAMNGQSITLPPPNAPHSFGFSTSEGGFTSSGNSESLPDNQLQHRSLGQTSGQTEECLSLQK